MKVELNSAVVFKNFTDEVFVGKWDGVSYTFAPGQETYMEMWKAVHFAKHLIDRELHKAGFMTNDKNKRLELEQKAVVVPGTAVAETEIIDRNMKEEVKKGKKGKKVEQEEEFSELKE